MASPLAATRGTRHAPAIGFAALLLLPLSAAFPLDSKPHVVVRFEVQAPAFRRNMPELAQARAAVGAMVGGELARRYGFADWPHEAPVDAAARLGSLVLRLEEEPAVPNPRIVVRLLALLGRTEEEPRPLSLPPVEIYAPTNPNWDTASRRAFETRVGGVLAETMRTDAFHERFFAGFVRNLPIATRVTPKPVERVIEVPVSWREILFAPESAVVVRFQKIDGAVAREGSLRLTPVAPHVTLAAAAGGEPTIALRGAIAQASFGAAPLELVGHWNDGIPELLRDAEVRCFIAEYHPREFVGTLGSLVLDPD